jgi:hypothetical protein
MWPLLTCTDNLHNIIDIIGPDPFAVVSQDDNTASLRLFTHYDPSDWRIIQDHPEYSIFNVLSSLGGMWTVFNGIFAVIFGGSMLLVFGKFYFPSQTR